MMQLRLARNALANLLAAAIPALVMLVTVPLVVRGLGEAGYGVYSLVTAIVGYFAVIDINLTAGSVKYIAQHKANDDDDQIAETVSFGLASYAAIGLVGGVGIFACAGWLVDTVFAVPEVLRADARTALQLAAPGFLFGQMQAYLNSVPQALMRYDMSGRVEIVIGVLVPLATVGVLLLGGGLADVIALRVVASMVHGLTLWHAIGRLLPTLRWRWPGVHARAALLSFSGWSFLSRFATLSYAHADKLIIGAMAGVTALAYFTVAATLANRVLGLGFRLSGVFFPAASALAATGQLRRLDQTYVKATRYVVFVNAAILALLAVFAYPILAWWMNADFARHGALILAVMALAQFVDSLTSLPSLVNDGMGHPRVSGLFAVTRALVGLVLLYAGIRGWGVVGAAWAHLAGALLFTGAFLVYVHGRTVPTPLGRLLLHGYLPGLAGVGLVATAAGAATRLLGGSPLDIVLSMGAMMLLLVLHGALFVVAPDDRALAWSRWRTWRRQAGH